MKRHFACLLLATICMVGCDEPDATSDAGAKSPDAAAPVNTTPKVVEAQGGVSPAAVDPPTVPPPPPGVAVDPLPVPAPVIPPPPPPVGDTATSDAEPEVDGDYELVQAVVGVGKKGQYDSNDYISTVVSARFRAAQTIEFAKIPRAMQMYKAESRGQKGPRSHEEFMKKIIDANLIRLPELPDGEVYRYVPEKETLFVARPKG